jgi:hypothetical protein
MIINQFCIKCSTAKTSGRVVVYAYIWVQLRKKKHLPDSYRFLVCICLRATPTVHNLVASVVISDDVSKRYLQLLQLLLLLLPPPPPPPPSQRLPLLLC